MTVDRRNIVARLDFAIERAAFRCMAIRAIYLDDEDQRALNDFASEAWGSRVVQLQHGGFPVVSGDAMYRDVSIRPGKRSVLYSKHGVALVVPKVLSARVAAR